MSNDDIKFLFQIFNFLRNRGIPIGLEEYAIALHCLSKQNVMELESEESLIGLCKLLWAKSQSDLKLVEEAFDLFYVNIKPLLLNPEFHNPEPIDGDIKNGETTEFNSTPKDEPIETNIREDHESNSNLENDSSFSKNDEETSSGFQHYPISEGLLSTTCIPEKFQNYIFTPQLHIDFREVSSLWYSFSQRRRVGRNLEFDIDGTINDICLIGDFISPRMRPKRENVAQLTLLVDQQGSMDPYMMLVDEFIVSISNAVVNSRLRILYFHDTPHLLYSSPHLDKDILPFDQFLTQIKKDTSILFLSDAGAARGNYEKVRLETTVDLVSRLFDVTYLVAWINPLPDFKWRENTAASIANSVPMFPLTREGVIDSINVLRGIPNTTMSM